MKITNPSTVEAATQVVVTYTIEAGDPLQFFFEIVENGESLDFAGKQIFSGSGTFITAPGYLGPHVIEAYNSTAVVGKNPPFATGPTYTVLPASSTPTIPVVPTPTITTKPVVTTQPTTPAKPLPTTVATRIEPTSSTQGNLGANSPAPSLSTLSDVVLSGEFSAAAAAGSAITMYESIQGSTGTRTVVEQVSQTAPFDNSSSSGPSPIGRPKPTDFDAIIGASVAGAVVFAIIVVFLVRRCLKRNPESKMSDSPSTIDPFLAFSARLRGKHSTGFIRLASESRISVIEPVSRTSGKTASVSTASTSRSDLELGIISPGTQMEWVLRPTNDPPPGYDMSV
ncbi:hypothetical protein B0H11DRAFT_2213580 [Mycena galericulata]|nr:hypothetical protein B0H11DRAFT_2213580 [Mycena galericulata]